MCVNDAKINPVLNKTKVAIASIVKSRHVTSRHVTVTCTTLWNTGEKISLSVPPLVRRVKDSHTSGRRKCMTSLSRDCNCWMCTHRIIQNTSQFALEAAYALINNAIWHSRRGSYTTQFFTPHIFRPIFSGRNIYWKNKIVCLLQQYFERVEMLSGSKLSQSMCCMEFVLCI